MPYSNTPIVSTYSTHQLPAVYDLEVVAGYTAVDPYVYLENILPRKDAQGEYGETRYCVSARQVAVSTTNNQMCRGIYVWEKTVGTTYYFCVVHDDTASTSKVYSSTDAITWAAVNTLGTDAVTPVRFTEFIDATNTKKLVMVDGLEGYVFTTNAAGTKIVDADFPSPHVPFPIFLDGYLFLAKAATGDIYNSDLNDPAAWTAGSFISAEMFPDDIQALLKINNYLVSVGTQSCEYFYDAANPTASPLARVDGLVMGFGTIFPNSIASNKDTAIFLANNNDGEVCFKVIQGTQQKDISGPFIPFLVTDLSNSSYTASQVRGCFLRQGGDLFYNFNVATGAISSRSFMYSLETNKWIKTSGAGGDYPVFFTSATNSTSSTTFVGGHTYVKSGQTVTNTFFGKLAGSTLVSGSPGSTCKDNFTGTFADAYQIQQTIKSPFVNFGTLNRKFISRFGINYFPALGTTTNTTITLQMYKDAGLNQSAQISSSIFVDTGFPFITQLGTARQMVFKVTYTGDYAVRWNGFEVDINKGQQ